MFSDDTIISLLNAYFVPGYGNTADYGFYQKALVSAEETEAFMKIYRRATEKGFEYSVDYYCTPDGDLIHPRELGIESVGSPEQYAAVLKAIVKKLNVPSGKPVVPPRNQNSPPNVAADALTLHLTSRRVDGNQRSVKDLPGEDWVVYSRKEWTKFLPPAGAPLGTSWDVDCDVATKLLSNFYPTFDAGPVQRIEYEKASIKATLVSKDRVRLDVSQRMKRKYPVAYERTPVVSVEATAVGVVDLDPAKKTIQRFVMATEKATCDGGMFGVTVRSVTP